jgi:hypothetical protein
MEKQEQLEIEGISELDVADLRERLMNASIDPSPLIARTRRHSLEVGSRLGEPATIALVLALTKVVVPAVASVITAWLATRKSRKVVLRRDGETITVVENGEFNNSLDIGPLINSGAKAQGG